jgi:hypothetical protein
VYLKREKTTSFLHFVQDVEVYIYKCLFNLQYKSINARTLNLYETSLSALDEAEPI